MIIQLGRIVAHPKRQVVAIGGFLELEILQRHFAIAVAEFIEGEFFRLREMLVQFQILHGQRFRKPDDPMPVDVARIDPGAAVSDIIMTRQPTPLLVACAARGIRAQPGFEMLVQQVPEYLRFMGQPALAEVLQADLSEVRGLLVPK